MGGISYYDDNYGSWEIEDASDVEFFHATQARNVEKRCEGCARVVRIRPEAGFCNICADERERGY